MNISLLAISTTSHSAISERLFCYHTLTLPGLSNENARNKAS